MIKACVIGQPISHSRSPLIHQHWLKQAGIAASYERVDVSPENLAAFLSSLDRQGYVGCNITLPHKEKAIALLANISAIAKASGSVNTVYIENGKLQGTSTDGEGFYQNLRQTIPDINLANKVIIILGAGGSARAIVARLLAEQPRSIQIINRNKTRAELLTQIFGPVVTAHNWDEFEALAPHCELLVNTTSLGMMGQPPLILDLAPLPTSAIVADIVYVPLITPLLLEARKLDLRIVPGLGMLLHQAVPGFEKWFGVKPLVTQELYDLIAADIPKIAP